MSPVAQAVLASWSFPAVATALNLLAALPYIRGEATLEDAIASTRLETRQYAKRQWTWFRRDPEIHWLRGFGDDSAIGKKAREIAQKIYKNSTAK